MEHPPLEQDKIIFTLYEEFEGGEAGATITAGAVDGEAGPHQTAGAQIQSEQKMEN